MARYGRQALVRAGVRGLRARHRVRDRADLGVPAILTSRLCGAGPREMTCVGALITGRLPAAARDRRVTPAKAELAFHGGRVAGGRAGADVH